MIIDVIGYSYCELFFFRFKVFYERVLMFFYYRENGCKFIIEIYF